MFIAKDWYDITYLWFFTGEKPIFAEPEFVFESINREEAEAIIAGMPQEIRTYISLLREIIRTRNEKQSHTRSGKTKSGVLADGTFSPIRY